MGLASFGCSEKEKQGYIIKLDFLLSEMILHLFGGAQDIALKIPCSKLEAAIHGLCNNLELNIPLWVKKK